VTSDHFSTQAGRINFLGFFVLLPRLVSFDKEILHISHVYLSALKDEFANIKSGSGG
jgi:hypothetical protein